MKLEEVHKDERGSTFVLKDGENELAVVSTSYDGALRGGHSHPYNTQIVVIKGVVDYVWTETTPEESKRARYDVNNPVVIIPKDVPHVTISVGDSVMLELKGSQEYKAENYPPYRKLIEMKKPMNLNEVLEILKVT